MKILVLNGSPKGAKSDVMHITRAFLDGINEEKQHDIHVINIIYKHIEYCTGCFACMHHGGTCIHDDDMKEMLEEILESDLLILSFPLYCYGMPAPLNAVLLRYAGSAQGVHGSHAAAVEHGDAKGRGTV